MENILQELRTKHEKLNVSLQKNTITTTQYEQYKRLTTLLGWDFNAEVQNKLLEEYLRDYGVM